MLDRVGTIGGRLGYAEPFKRPAETLDQTATIGSWLITMPGASPWNQWMLCVMHLRDIPGVKPSYHRYEGSEYELMLWALDPVELASVESMETTPIKLLRPPSGVFQFHNGGRDDRAIALGEAVAHAIVLGVLPPEPAGDPGAIAWWKQCIEATAAHDQEGRHG